MKNKYGKQETTNRKVGSFFVDKNCAEIRYIQKQIGNCETSPQS